MVEINKLPAIQVTNTVKQSENKWEHWLLITTITTVKAEIFVED